MNPSSGWMSTDSSDELKNSDDEDDCIGYPVFRSSIISNLLSYSGGFAIYMLMDFCSLLSAYLV